ncbi:hypothetical protein PGT21_029954 [Puccinia graminis f. sp. tritici]|uniref:Uncharacterized protein n=1 Tax=Puccinia graminis f. sp. tritici TaxID=56615 RepID=A0A5B0PSG0_PUCGR|nr:hypothetical protein PGTUg99_014198 [Puccinia graminis f. sp. tritici]KAA1104695.1 hypothetical protein PGT21_029954 [Puccinia graminis f. sp. tritici]
MNRFFTIAAVLVTVTIIASIDSCTVKYAVASRCLTDGCKTKGWEDGRLMTGMARWECYNDHCPSNVIYKNKWVRVRDWCQGCVNARVRAGQSIKEDTNMY